MFELNKERRERETSKRWGTEGGGETTQEENTWGLAQKAGRNTEQLIIGL